MSARLGTDPHAAYAEAQERYMGRRMHVGTVVDREIAAFIAGAAWVADRREPLSVCESVDRLAERYVGAFMGENPRATIQRDRLVEMVANVIREALGATS